MMISNNVWDKSFEKKFVLEWKYVLLDSSYK